MRLKDLVNPPSRSIGSIAEVFIIESLTLSDEAQKRFEGRVLADVLTMCGKKPIYYYIRTKKELQALADKFVASRYRYLHLSCHGGDTELEMTLDSVKYQDFAKMFADRLNHRRLFVSACAAGNEMLSELVGAKNTEMYSVAAPIEDIRFDHAVAFWSAFYVKAFSLNAKSMNSTRSAAIIRDLAKFFEVSMHWSTYSSNKAQWAHEVIKANT